MEKGIKTVSGVVEGSGMDAHKALAAFTAFKESGALTYLTSTAQKSVNKDFADQLPAHLAGRDVDASDIRLSETTRQKFIKLSRAIELGISMVRNIAETEKVISQNQLAISASAAKKNPALVKA